MYFDKELPTYLFRCFHNAPGTPCSDRQHRRQSGNFVYTCGPRGVLYLLVEAFIGQGLDIHLTVRWSMEIDSVDDVAGWRSEAQYMLIMHVVRARYVHTAYPACGEPGSIVQI